MSDFLAFGLKSVIQVLVPEIKEFGNNTPNEFDTFQDELNLYEGVLKWPKDLLDKLSDVIPLEMLKALLRTEGEPIAKFPMPQVIQGTVNFMTNEFQRHTEKINAYADACVCVIFRLYFQK